MLPKNVLHKRNGHRHPPRPGIRSAGEIMGLVHPDLNRTSGPRPDLVGFGAIIQSELPDDQWEQIVERGMSLPSALARALTRTREAFERGELVDLHVALEELRAQASAAAETIARLTNAARSSERTVAPHGGRCLLNVNDVVLHALSTAAAAGPVSSQLDPRLPRVVADPAQLDDLLSILLHAVAGVRDAGGRPGPVIVRTSHHGGVMRGERVVCVLVTDDEVPTLDHLRPVAIAPVPAAEECGTEPRAALHRAAGLAREHGGVLCTASLPGGGVCYTLELPAA